MGFLQPGNPPAFLIDEDRRIASLDRVPQLGNQRFELLRIRAIPRKKNEAKGVSLPKKPVFLP
jgi:hypothetical protein